MPATDRTVKSFLYKRMYGHWRLNRSHSKARRVVRICSACCSPSPTACRRRGASAPSRPSAPARARVVADYIAGMTDRYALEEHRRLFDLWS